MWLGRGNGERVFGAAIFVGDVARFVPSSGGGRGWGSGHALRCAEPPRRG